MKIVFLVVKIKNTVLTPLKQHKTALKVNVIRVKINHQSVHSTMLHYVATWDKIQTYTHIEIFEWMN